MFGSVILDVAISIIFIYLFLSLIGSALNEWISGILKLRSRNLEKGIRNMLNDPDGSGDTKGFYNHPLITALTNGNRKPSYIPPRIFALALLDMVVPADPEKGSRTVSEIREGVGNIQNEKLKKILLVNLDEAQDNIARVYQNLEKWFDEGMQRVSGWYKRTSQWIVLGYALVIAVGMNVDTISIAGTLYQNGNLRAGLVAAAENVAKQPLGEGSRVRKEQINAINVELGKLHFPIGWNQQDEAVPNSPTSWFVKICGWLITALAVSLGAPFWFDVLNKAVNLRAAGKKPEEEKEKKKK